MKILQSLFSRGAKRDERAAGALALAKDLQKKGEPHAAMAAYREALDHGASAAPIHLQLGVLHASLSEHERAIEHLEKALELAPDDADALCMLGTVMNDLRRFEEAAALFERALALRPDFAEAHFNLGLARFERSDFRAAAHSFARCAVLNRGEPWSEARRADLSAGGYGGERNQAAPRLRADRVPAWARQVAGELSGGAGGLPQAAGRSARQGGYRLRRSI